MREIKFRGKRLECEEHLSPWAKGSLFHDMDCWGNIIGSWIYEFDSQHGRQFQYEVDPKTVNQYIGLKNKYGQEIYEGDIAKGQWFDKGVGHRHIGEVKYICSSFKVRGIKQYAGIDADVNGNYEVIGNKWDNPELLEVTK